METERTPLVVSRARASGKVAARRGTWRACCCSLALTLASLAALLAYAAGQVGPQELARGRNGEGGEGGDGAMCPGVLYPGAGAVLGEDDGLHVTVVLQGCGMGIKGKALSLRVNDEVETIVKVEAEEEWVHDLPLLSLRLGYNRIEVRLGELRAAGGVAGAEEGGGGGGQARHKQGLQVLLRYESTFVVTWEAVVSSFADAVLAHAPDPQAEEEDRWPLRLDGTALLPRHAVVMQQRPQLMIDFPTPGYTFKRMKLGPSNFAPFVRLNKASLVHGCGLALSLDGREWQWYGQAYFVTLDLPDGEHDLHLALTTPDGAHRVTPVARVPFVVNQTLEYDEDGPPQQHAGGGALPPDAGGCTALVAAFKRANAMAEAAGALGVEDAAVGGGEEVRRETDDEERCRMGVQGECGRGECVAVEGAGGGGEEEGRWGVCECEADVIGVRCSHSLLEDLRYLPQRDPRVGAGRRFGACREALALEKLAMELQERLETLQWPATWEQDKILHLSLNDTSGFGVTMHLLSQALSSALRSNQTLVVDGVFTYFRHRGCSGGAARRGSLSCMFQAMHGECPRDLIDAANRAQTAVYTANYQMANDWHVPTRFLRRGGSGVFLFVAQLTSFVMTPNRQLLALLRRVKRTIGYRHPIMAVHVRHGDSCPKWEDAHSHLPGAKCQGLERYLEGMIEMYRRYGVRRAFVSTDDPSIIEQLPYAQAYAARTLARTPRQPHTAKPPQSNRGGGGRGGGEEEEEPEEEEPEEEEEDGVRLEFVHLPFDRGVFAASDWAIELKLLMARMDRRLVAETTLLDILLMSHADYLVGTLSSHFGALAYELSVATKGYHPPYISLDFPWRSSLLSPVSFYDEAGATEHRTELNPTRRDFFKRPDNIPDA